MPQKHDEWTTDFMNEYWNEQNEGMCYHIAARAYVFMWHHPRFKGGYGRRGFRHNCDYSNRKHQPAR